jgi:hypothetical protein
MKYLASAGLVLFVFVGSVLSRMDGLRAAHAANAAQLRLVRAELELVRVRYMTPEQPRTAVDQLCRDRVEALRDGIRVLQRVGKVELEDFPGMRWRSWE